MIFSVWLARVVGGSKMFLNAVLECNFQTCIKSACLFLTSHAAVIVVHHYVVMNEFSHVGNHRIKEGILKMKGLPLQI